MAHENRSTYIHMRISKTMKELIREQAKKEGMSISEYVEDACMRCIEADKEEGKS
jgi:Ribbon-helix-helix protein, copG family.